MTSASPLPQARDGGACPPLTPSLQKAPALLPSSPGNGVCRFSSEEKPRNELITPVTRQEDLCSE